jgi:Ca2+-binding EF-hand superfamily protein
MQVVKEDAATVIKHTIKTAKTELTFRNLYLLEGGAKTLTKALPNDNDYDRLAVEKCSLGDDGTKILAKQALGVPAKCRNLRGLYLCANSIGPAGAKSLASALKHLRELRTLRLDSNAVLCEGAKALFSALPDTKLERIGLMNNQVGDSGCNALAKVMVRCPALTSVNLEANRITDSACRKIMLALPKSSVDNLELSLNRITERGEKMVQRGRVAQARERKIRKTFDTIDEDGSGELDKHEVAAMAAALGAPLIESMGSIHLSTRKLDEAFAQMDPNGDGTVSFHEFHEWYDKYVADALGAPEPEPELEPESESAEEQRSDDKAPQDATQAMVARIWEYRRRATLPPSYYSKEAARKLRAELAEMKLEALTKRAQSLGVAEHKLEKAATRAGPAEGGGSPRDTKPAIIDLIMNRDPFQDNVNGLVDTLREHGQHPRVGCGCSRDAVACARCVRAALLAEKCCWALRLLVTEACASATTDGVGVWLRCKALEVIHQTMENHPATTPPVTPHDSVIQENGCHAVQLVVEKLGADAQAYACEIGYCETVVAALNNTKLAAVHERAAAALRALSKDCFLNKFRIGDVGGVEALVHSLKLHSTTPEIVTHTLWSLWYLCCPPDQPNGAGQKASNSPGEEDSEETTLHKQWAASNHRRAVAVKAADAAVSAKAKFPWVDSVQDGSIGLLGVIGEVPASAALGRARAMNVAQDFKLAADAQPPQDTGRDATLPNNAPLALLGPAPPVSAMSISAKLSVADATDVDDGWGESPIRLPSEIYDAGCVVDITQVERDRDHQKTTEMVNNERVIKADQRESQARVNRVKEMEAVPYIEIHKQQKRNADIKDRLRQVQEEEKRKMMMRYMQREGLEKDEAEWHDHQAKKIQKATRARQARKKGGPKKKDKKKARARPLSKDQKAALKKKKQQLKREKEAALAEKVRIAEEEAQAARTKARSRWRTAGLRLAAQEQAHQVVEGMKTEHAQMAQEEADSALNALMQELESTQQQMAIDVSSSRDSFPYEEPHWTEVCPLAPILPPLKRGDAVIVNHQWKNPDEAINAKDDDHESTRSATGTSIASESMVEGTIQREHRYQPGSYFVKFAGLREPVEYNRQQLLQRLTPEEFVAAEAKHLEALALQTVKDKQAVERKCALELLSQMMDLMLPELTMSAALGMIHEDDGLVVQAVQQAEKEAEEAWNAQLEEKRIRLLQQRQALIDRKREQMIKSYIAREGWEMTDENRQKAFENAAAEKIQKMFIARRNGQPYGLHDGSGKYKRKPKRSKKSKDKKVLKAEAKLAKVDKAKAAAEKEAKEALEARKRAEQEQREAEEAAAAAAKEMEEARLAQEKAEAEKEEARLAAEAAAKELEEARIAQEKADAEYEDVRNAQAALKQAEKDLQDSIECCDPKEKTAELQQKVHDAKANLEKEEAEYVQYQARADMEKQEAAAAQEVADREAAEAAAAEELAAKEMHEAEEAILLAQREAEEARLAKENADKEQDEAERAKRNFEKQDKAARAAKGVLAQYEEGQEQIWREEDEEDERQRAEDERKFKEEQERRTAEEEARIKEQENRRLAREADELREREMLAYRKREEEKERLIKQAQTEAQEKSVRARNRFKGKVHEIVERRNTRILLEEAQLRGIDLLKTELMSNEEVDNLMTEEVYSQIYTQMENWLQENPGLSLQILDVVAAWVYSMGPGKVEDGAAAEGDDDYDVRHSFEIYYLFNRSMRSITVSNKADPRYRWLHYHLSNAVHHVPGIESKDQKLYRGQRKLYPSDNCDDGAVIQWKDYKSTSTDEKAARNFAGDSGILFIISDCPPDFGASFAASSEDMQPLTAWPKESEILMPAGVTFRVMEKKKQKDGVTTIELSYVGEWMEEQEAPTVEAIKAERKKSKAMNRRQKSGMCSWLSCLCGGRSSNDVSKVYIAESPESPIKGGPSEELVVPAVQSPDTMPPSPQLPGTMPQIIEPAELQSPESVKHDAVGWDSTFKRVAGEFHLLTNLREQKDLRAELVVTHKMPEGVFSAVLQKMTGWAADNPDELISHKKPDLIAAWVYTMGRPASTAQMMEVRRTTAKDYELDSGIVVTDMEVRNSFRVYNTFNESMRSTKVPRHAEPEYKWMHYHMSAAVRHVQGASKDQRLYRGQPQLYNEPYKEGDIVQWNDFKSTSTESEIASKFAGENGFLLSIVEGVSENLGANFNQTNPPLSAWPEEDEILLPAGATFRVLKHEPPQTNGSPGAGQTRIELKFLGEWVDTSFKDASESGVTQLAHRYIHVVSATGLARADLLGKSDPYAVISVEDQGEWIRVDQTEHINNTLEPVWQANVFREEITQFYIDGRLQPPKEQMKVRVQIYDFDDTDDAKDDDFLGQVVFSTDGDEVVFEEQSLPLEGDAEDHPFYKPQGAITVAVRAVRKRSGEPVPELEPEPEPEMQTEEPESEPEQRPRYESHAYPTAAQLQGSE